MLALRTSLLRSTLPISRRTIVSVAESGPNPQAGATARARGWNQREKAQEDQYIIQHEREKLKQLREHLKQQEELVDKLHKESNESK